MLIPRARCPQVSEPKPPGLHFRTYLAANKTNQLYLMQPLRFALQLAVKSPITEACAYHKGLGYCAYTERAVFLPKKVLN